MAGEEIAFPFWIVWGPVLLAFYYQFYRHIMLKKFNPALSKASYIMLTKDRAAYKVLIKEVLISISLIGIVGIVVWQILATWGDAFWSAVLFIGFNFAWFLIKKKLKK